MSEPRRAYSYRTASADYSVSEKTLRRLVKAGKIRTKDANGLIRLHPDDLERLFGFGRPKPILRAPSPSAMAVARRLLS
jgi:hypothetical protein